MLDADQGAQERSSHNGPQATGVAMKTFDTSMTQEFERLLAVRERELCAVLDANERPHSTNAAEPQEVTDFKDLAREQSLARVDEAEAEQAALELEQVLAARRRLQEHSYGDCLDCGAAIDLRRLTAMPASVYCTSCQAAHETSPAPHAGH
jgi:DnaK suppressor protein